MKLWHSSGHDVGPACKKFVPLPLHCSSGCIQQYGELVAEQTELLWPENYYDIVSSLYIAGRQMEEEEEKEEEEK